MAGARSGRGRWPRARTPASLLNAYWPRNHFYASGPREDPSEPPHALTTDSSQTRRR
jgi:hypothetical protein